METENSILLLLIYFKHFKTFSNSQVLKSLRKKCPNTEFFVVRIQSECGKIRTRKKSIFAHFSRSANVFPGIISSRALFPLGIMKY